MPDGLAQMFINFAEQQKVIEQILSAAAKLQLNNATALQQVLEGFVALGFSSARYYESAYNTPTRDELFVLSAAVGNGSDRIGYRIHHLHSTFGRAGGLDPVIGGSADPGLTPEEKQWVKDLGLGGSAWIDLPLIVGSKLLGLIACGYDETIVSLQGPDLVALGLLASKIAANLALAPLHALETTRARIAPALGEDDLLILLAKAADEIRVALHGAIFAVFEHRLESDCLVKILEHADPALTSHYTEFKETYWPDLPSLTRQAW